MSGNRPPQSINNRSVLLHYFGGFGSPMRMSAFMASVLSLLLSSLLLLPRLRRERERGKIIMIITRDRERERITIIIT